MRRMGTFKANSGPSTEELHSMDGPRFMLDASERTARSRGFGPHDSWPHARHPSKASGDAPSLRLAPRKALAMWVFDATLYQIYPLGMSGIPCLYYGSE